MADEKSKCNEMTPAEDGTKVPLNTDKTEEPKCEANPNGDAKIDIGDVRSFTGLTKTELEKYSNDPFWIRLRWSLFILFWAGWAAMLMMAIVIIIRAPGCEPPPVRSWIEEGALYEVDTSNLPTKEELLFQIQRIGVNSVYMPGLINENDFSMSNYNADALIKGLVDANKYVATDLPDHIRFGNPLYQNASIEELVDVNGNLNYTNVNLTALFVKNLLDIWIDRGVKGFMMQSITTHQQEQFMIDLNNAVKEKDGAVGGNIFDMRNEPSIKLTNGFREYLIDHKKNWSFYKFQANYEAGSQMAEYQVRLMNIAMFAFRGTPILQYFNQKDMSNSTARFLNDLSDFRHQDGIKFGDVHFANNSDDVISFTRVRKGTPAYAIALNFGDETQIVEFNGTKNVAEKGTIELYSKIESFNDHNDQRQKVDLGAVELQPFNGMIIQFVASFA